MPSNSRSDPLPAQASLVPSVEPPVPPDASRGESWRQLIERLSDRIAKPRVSARRRLQDSVHTAELLLSESGDAEGQRVAAALAEVLRSLQDAELLQFFLCLANKFGPDDEQLKAAAQAYLSDPSQENAAALNLAAEPRRVELLRRLNMAPEGTALIVKLRENALELAKANPNLAPLVSDMRELLSSWFNRGFLKAEKIDWCSPAAVLENIIRYEAVHEIRDWNSLRSRLQGNRRCFGFFHPAMPGVPLIFVEVALTREMSGAIAPLLSRADQEAPLKAPANAIFYSINNCHSGLRGISLGDLLIKQVVLDLRTEFPSLKHFATLSPIPGFRKWLAAAERQSQLVPPVVSETLARDDWWLDAAQAERVRQPLMNLCAEYLTGRSPDGSLGRVMDPVARFHLTNGARLERINWLADASPKGIAESCGLMVNYRYRLNSIEANHRAFVNDDQVIASVLVKQLREAGAKGGQRLSLTAFLPSLRRKVHAPKGASA
jgi:malonyl-CoA decarboxylase